MQRKTGQAGAGQRQQLRFALGQRRRRDHLDMKNVIPLVLQHANAAQHRKTGHKPLPRLRQEFRKAIEPQRVKRCGPAVLSQTDGHHFGKAAFIEAMEIRVGFDLVEYHNTVGLGGITVAIQGQFADPVI